MTMNNAPLSARARAWVDKTLDSLSLDELIAQKLAPLLDIPWDPSQTREALLERAHRFQVGAVHACSSLPPARQAEEVAKLQAGMKVPALVTCDIETSSAYPGSTGCGAAMNFGAIADAARAEEVAFECGRLAARQARAMGLAWAFGPVVDIPLNYDNPMVATRAFSGDPDRIAALSCALLRGLQAGGIAATLKHFPGDGTDNRDQHAATPFNPMSLEQWRATYGRTFGSGIQAGVDAVMVGHFAMPAISSRDPRTGRCVPAPLDPRIMKGLLRDELGFEGVIVSDAIPMGGTLAHCASIAEASIRFILAGGDVVLFVEQMETVMAGVKQALRDRRYTEDALRASVRRILSLKAKLGLHDGTHAALSLEEAERDRPAIAALARESAEASVTLVRDDRKLLPLALPPGAKVTVCVTPDEPLASEGIQLPEETLGQDVWPPIAKRLRDRGFRVACVSGQKAFVREAADSAAAILITQCHPIAGRNSIRISREGIRCFDWQTINSETPVIYVNMGSPFTLWEVAAIHNCVCTYSGAEACHEAALRAILGEIPFSGQLPVALDFEDRVQHMGCTSV